MKVTPLPLCPCLLISVNTFYLEGPDLQDFPTVKDPTLCPTPAPIPHIYREVNPERVGNHEVLRVRNGTFSLTLQNPPKN